MAEVPGRQKSSGTVDAGDTLALTFSDMGAWQTAVCLVKAALPDGAALAVSAQAQPAEDEDWYDVRITPLTGADAQALAASVAMAATATVALFALRLPTAVGSVRVNFLETGGVTDGSTVTAWLVTD